MTDGWIGGQAPAFDRERAPSPDALSSASRTLASPYSSPPPRMTRVEFLSRISLGVCLIAIPVFGLSLAV